MAFLRCATGRPHRETGTGKDNGRFVGLGSGYVPGIV